MSFTFRLRFILHERIQLNTDESSLPLSKIHSPHVVELHSLETGKPIKESRWLSVMGQGYKSRKEAEIAGKRWRSAVEQSFALHKIGADFGSRGPKSFMYQAGLEMMEKKSGSRILNDTHGLMVFETEPRPLFVRLGSPTVILGKDVEPILRSIEQAYSKGILNDSQWRLAYELYAASFFEHSADARFLTLMMAVETLIIKAPRTQQITNHIEKLITDTKKSVNDQSECNSLVMALEDLKLQSIGQAGRQLARRLKDRKFENLTAVELFNKCYKIRNLLVHGQNPRPVWKDVNHLTGLLETFVGELLTTYSSP